MRKHKNFKLLGYECTKLATPDSEGRRWYLYVPGARMRVTRFHQLLISAIKHKFGVKEWYK